MLRRLNETCPLKSPPFLPSFPLETPSAVRQFSRGIPDLMKRRLNCDMLYRMKRCTNFYSKRIGTLIFPMCMAKMD